MVRKATLAAVSACTDSLFHSSHELTTGCTAPGDRGIFSALVFAGAFLGSWLMPLPGIRRT